MGIQEEPKHQCNTACHCKYCIKLDIMFGDYTLSAWESKFICSVAAYGWGSDYTPKQKAVIDRLFAKQQKAWLNQQGKTDNGSTD